MSRHLARAASFRLSRFVGHHLWFVAPKDVRNPVFIVGSGRSGTTLLLRSLATHPTLAVFPSEANDFWYPHTYPRATAAVEAPVRWQDPHGFQAVADRHFLARDREKLKSAFATFQRLQRRPVFVNKSAALSLMLPRILDLFPDARFLHMLRDGRSVICSQAIKARKTCIDGTDPEPVSMLEQRGRYWSVQVEEIDRCAASVPFERRILEIRYEELCARPRAVLGDAAEFCGVDPTGFRSGRLPEMEARTGRCLEDLAPADRRRVIEAMEATLVRKGYLPRDAASG